MKVLMIVSLVIAVARIGSGATSLVRYDSSPLEWSLWNVSLIVYGCVVLASPLFRRPAHLYIIAALAFVITLIGLVIKYNAPMGTSWTGVPGLTVNFTFMAVPIVWMVLRARGLGMTRGRDHTAGSIGG